MKLNSKELRSGLPTQEQIDHLQKNRNEIYIILDSVLDTYNIGAIFRLADAVAAKKIYLCGGTESPPNSRIQKASVNTWQWVEWEYASTAVEAVEKVRKFSTTLEQYSSSEAKLNREVKIIAVEQTDKSIPYNKADYSFPVALVVGHETEGVSKEVLDLCDEIVELPMHGINTSLNVMVSLGIVLYKATEKCLS